MDPGDVGVESLWMPRGGRSLVEGFGMSTLQSKVGKHARSTVHTLGVLVGT